MTNESGDTLNRDEGLGPHRNVAVAGDGTVYVCDGLNARVQAFGRDGVFLRAFGQLGDAPGSFARPKGVALDRAGHVYVVDAAFNNVQIFEPDGRLLLAFGSIGSFNPAMLVHGEQAITLHGPIPTQGEVETVGTITGTSPTLDITLQHSSDGTNWVTLRAFSQLVSGSANSTTHLFAASATDYLIPVLPYVRASYTAGGTTPSFGSVTVKLLLDE